MEYTLSPTKRTVILRKITDWMENDRLYSIAVVHVQGRGASESEKGLDTFNADELAAFNAPEELLDEMIGQHGQTGANLRWRAVFTDDDGKPDYQHAQRVSGRTVKAPPGTATGSKGQDAATESLSQALVQLGLAGRADNADAQALIAQLVQDTRTDAARHHDSSVTQMIREGNVRSSLLVHSVRMEAKAEREADRVKMLEAENDELRELASRSSIMDAIGAVMQARPEEAAAGIMALMQGGGMLLAALGERVKAGGLGLVGAAPTAATVVEPAPEHTQQTTHLP